MDKFDVKNCNGIVIITPNEIQRAKNDPVGIMKQVIKDNDQFNKDIINFCKKQMPEEEIRIVVYGDFPPEKGGTND